MASVAHSPLRCCLLDIFDLTGGLHMLPDRHHCGIHAVSSILRVGCGGTGVDFRVVQSYRLFRDERQDSALSVMRNLLPLALLVFLCSFSLTGSYLLELRAGQQCHCFVNSPAMRSRKLFPPRRNYIRLDPLQLTGMTWP